MKAIQGGRWGQGGMQPDGWAQPGRADDFPSPPTLLLLRGRNFEKWLRALFWGLVAIASWFALAPATQVPEVLRWWDKAQHTVGFAGLAFWGLVAYPRWPRTLFWGLVLFGVGIELAQAATGWRHGDWRDWSADCVGIVMGWLAWRSLQWWWNGRRNTNSKTR